MSSTVRLDDASIEAVARRVVELLDEGRRGTGLIDATEVARRYGVSRDWVYDHADELGAIRLGDGPSPRLRFDPARVESALPSCSQSRRASKAEEPPPKRNRRRQPPSATGTETCLLPIKGRNSAPGKSG